QNSGVWNKPFPRRKNVEARGRHAPPAAPSRTEICDAPQNVEAHEDPPSGCRSSKGRKWRGGHMPALLCFTLPNNGWFSREHGGIRTAVLHGLCCVMQPIF
uniref:Uncharacterized protein n=1 Tax=Aegilops tauschii subsp. strangulata TaxID=200361 RepID=A0A453Q4E1_AEGTS